MNLLVQNVDIHFSLMIMIVDIVQIVVKLTITGKMDGITKKKNVITKGFIGMIMNNIKNVINYEHI